MYLTLDCMGHTVSRRATILFYFCSETDKWDDIIQTALSALHAFLYVLFHFARAVSFYLCLTTDSMYTNIILFLFVSFFLYINIFCRLRIVQKQHDIYIYLPHTFVYFVFCKWKKTNVTGSHWLLQIFASKKKKS